VSWERAAELAFQGRFEAALAHTRRAATSPEVRWITAYVDAARGDFRRAERSLERLVSEAEASPDTRARAAATLGSVLRQSARHAEAQTIERRAAKTAPTPELRAHLLIGLAADAVGLGDLAAVDAAVKGIGPRPAGGWRSAVRLRWVRCERELLANRPLAAAGHARRALAISERAGARRHRAKSLLFLGASLADAAARDPSHRFAAAWRRESEGALRRARARSLSIGARPIARIAGQLLGRSPGRR